MTQLIRARGPAVIPTVSRLSSRLCKAVLAGVLIAALGHGLAFAQDDAALEPPVVEAKASAKAEAASAKDNPPVVNVQVEPDPNDGVGHPAELRPPVYATVDANGVNLISGAWTLSEPINSIGGGGAQGLASSNLYLSGVTRSTKDSYFQLSDDRHYVYTNLVLEGESLTFRGQASGGSTPVAETTGHLSYPNSVITYTAADGRVATFENRSWSSNNPTPIGMITSLKYPTGEILTFSSQSGVGATGVKVESSLGYALVGPGGGFSAFSPVAANLKNGGCDPVQCSGPTYANLAQQGRVFLQGNGPIRNATGDKPRYYSVDYVADDERVVSFSDGVSAWTYSYVHDIDTYEFVGTQLTPTDGILTTTATDPLGNTRVVTSRTSNGHVLSDVIREASTHQEHVTTYQYIGDGQTANQGKLGLGKIQQVTLPGGDRFWYVIDGNLNVTAKWHIPKGAPAGVDPEVTTIPGAVVARASYGCRPTFAGGQNCKSPNWTRDELGNQTDYAYDAITGELTTVAQPAPVLNGVRPQTRYTYGSFHARYVANGAMQDGTTVRRLIQTSTCATLASCAGTADETVTSYTYEDSSQPNNVRLLSATTRSGDSVLVATTSYTYNDRGDVITTDGPLAGSADLVQTRYDASRWKIGVVGPDPDGTGPLQFPATYLSYRADGQVADSYVGTVADRSDATYTNSFNILGRGQTLYDAQARPATARSFGTDGVVFAASQITYDIIGRPICQAQRMNAATFASLPASACTKTTPDGADGPDRITYTEYDDLNRVTKVTSGYDSATPRIEKEVKAYTLNGQEAQVADGAGHLTTYEYDALDRLWKVRYANATGTGSSTTDFDLYEYDPAGNRTRWRRRDCGPLASPLPACHDTTFTYDALNRVQNGVRGETYAYDNLGRRISAVYTGGSALATYDALGRMSSETTFGLTMAYKYDLTGNRTRITWPDGFYANYEYDLANRMTAVWDSRPFQLAAYIYDDLGRRVVTYRGNGAETYYSYDAASRLNVLYLDLNGTDNDAAWTYTYTAAGQVKSHGAYNTAYEWADGQTSKTYGVNGLNQLTTAGGAAISYNALGNLANDSATGYDYDALNNLIWTSGGAVLRYEPTGRLWHVWNGGVTMNFLYSGSNMVAEYADGVLARRYVPGAGVDEPLTWYEGSGTGDSRYPIQDPQGSVVSVTNNVGVSLHTNTYDEYGIPAVGNLGRFQYTGQAWIPEIGLYYYKARAYSPTLGRFLQTDPIGYGDGLNWYAYVGNDPLNRSDPTGMLQYSDGSDGCMMNCADGGSIGSAGRGGAPSQASPQIQLASSRSVPPPSPIQNPDGPHSVPGENGYVTYDENGPVKQLRETGKVHGETERPNVKEWPRNTDPSGKTRPGKGTVRPVKPGEARPSGKRFVLPPIRLPGPVIFMIIPPGMLQQELCNINPKSCAADLVA